MKVNTGTGCEFATPSFLRPSAGSFLSFGIFRTPGRSQSRFHAPHALMQARALPIPLCSFEPPLSKQFALRQLALMAREQLTQEAAFTRVEKEMMPQLLALTQ